MTTYVRGDRVLAFYKLINGEVMFEGRATIVDYDAAYDQYKVRFDDHPDAFFRSLRHRAIFYHDAADLPADLAAQVRTKEGTP